MKVVVATGNPGKLAEFERLLAPLGLECVPQSAFAIDEVEETASTFVENALLKARHASRMTGLPALADDSGLCVDALGATPVRRPPRPRTSRGCWTPWTADPRPSAARISMHASCCCGMPTIRAR